MAYGPDVIYNAEVCSRASLRVETRTEPFTFGCFVWVMQGFVVKNADSINEEAVALFCGSSIDIVASLLQDQQQVDGAVWSCLAVSLLAHLSMVLCQYLTGKNFRSVSSVFSTQLASLISQLQVSHRCTLITVKSPQS